MFKCLRCGRVLKNLESIERKYGKTCWNIIQLQKNDQDQDIQFLKCEINMLKRQYKELKAKTFMSSIEPIERIQQDLERPERDQFKFEFNVTIQELKIVLQNGSPLKKDFRYSDDEIGIKPLEIKPQIREINYLELLKPIEPITKIEKPPKIELIN